MDAVVPVVFGLVYLGMLLGHLPGLRLDRSGVALLGAIALLAAGRVAPERAVAAVDVSTIGLLFGLMIVSAQLRLGGFYSMLARRIGGAALSPAALLGALVAAAGALSALLVNDIVCLAMAPVVLEICGRRGLRPMPYLLGLACASNVGSAATLIGNPQNILVGQALELSFAGYLLDGGVPAALGLFATWGIIARASRGRWLASDALRFAAERRQPPIELAVALPPEPSPPFDRWQAAKGLVVLAAMVAAFLWGRWPREVVALTGAGLLLLSRRMQSQHVLGLVDWQLLVLFGGLFVVNDALAATGATQAALAWLGGHGVDAGEPGVLFLLAAALSNLVSNVPAVMLLLSAADGAGAGPLAGPILALASTLAGNLLLVGSIANLIVAEQAARCGVRVGWREHARIGVPVTLVTLALAAAWLWLRTTMLG